MNNTAKALVPLAVMAIAAPGMTLADAKQDYMTKCAVCHGADGQGGGSFTEYLRQGVPNLAVIAHNNAGVFPADKIASVIKGDVKGHGTRDMPLWGKSMSDAEVSAMVAYLKSIQAK